MEAAKPEIMSDSPYIINPTVSEETLYEAIVDRIDHTKALVMAMTGCSITNNDIGEFDSLSYEIRSNYILAIDRKVDEIAELFDAYEKKRKGGKHG